VCSSDLWVCPGTSSWRSLIGRSSARKENILNAARAGEKHGASGFLLTDWGDLGHRQHWPISLHTIAAGAQAAWDAKEPTADVRAVSTHAFADASRTLSPWIESLGDLDAPLRAHIRNAGAIFTELDLPISDELPKNTNASLEPWIELASTLDDFRASLPRTDEQTTRELANTLDICEVGIRKAIARRESAMTGRPIGQPTRDSIADLMQHASEERATLWRLRAREGGLAESITYDQRIIDDLLNETNT